MFNARTLFVFSALLSWSIAFSENAGADYPSDSAVRREAVNGLIVFVGGKPAEVIGLAEGLSSNEHYVLQCLVADDNRMEQMRAEIVKRGVSGKVTLRKLRGKQLPYSDNMVNGLIMADAPQTIDKGEVARVLTPQGVALMERDQCSRFDLGQLVRSEADTQSWAKLTKPRPGTMDSWTHYLYDAKGGVVSKDQKVGYPQHVQWEAGPRWSRSHENISAVTAMVTEGGRLFSIIDEGPRASVYLPPRVSLIARDAFNGALLWKQPISQWYNHLFPFKSGPHQLARRLVAIDDKVYVTLGIAASVSVIDAATGKIERVIEGSERTEEILWTDNKLLLRLSQKEKGLSSVAVYDLKSGEYLWKKPLKTMTPLTLSSDGRNVVCHADDQLYCMDILNGNVVWKTSMEDMSSFIATNAGPGVVLYKDVVVFASKEGLTALNAKTGVELWQKKSRISDYRSHTVVFVIDDVIWKAANSGWDKNAWTNAGTRIDDVFVGYDYQTGAIKQRIDIDCGKGEGIIHHRCHIPKAVGKYILTSWPGIEFVDTEGGSITRHNWIRGACLYGILPANGMIYVPPTPCVCYNQGKLNGFHAVTAKQSDAAGTLALSDRLEEGPGYKQLKSAAPSAATTTATDWATYRGNNARSGHSATTLGKSLKLQWRTSLGSRLTAPIVVQHVAYVADMASHTICAVGADGKILWRFLADGVVDSPPSYYQVSIYFGCRDGYVYSLNAEKGTLQWRFLTGMQDRQIISYDKLESQWPLHGSVTIENGKLYTVAGRSAFMDNGMVLYCLDPLTGKPLLEKRLYSLDERGEQPALSGRDVNRLSMNTIAPDILSSDGRRLYLRHKTYDLNGMEEAAASKHLYSAMGFLDKDYFHRTYWQYDNGSAGRTYAFRFGTGTRGRANTFGSKLAVMDAEHVYHFGSPTKDMRHFRPTSKACLASCEKQKETVCRWTITTPMLVRAMAIAGNTLYAAGPCGNWQSDPNVFEGREQIALHAYSFTDGSLLAAYALDALPAFDSMAIAGGRLYLSLKDGSLACWAAP